MLTGIVSPHQLPLIVRDLCGERRSAQLGAFIHALVGATLRSGQVGMDEDAAEALAAFRACNYERIYLRDASVRQGEAVVRVLRALVEHFADRPHLITETVAPRAAGRPGRQCAGDQGRRHLRGRHDRPLRLPPGGRPLGVGSRKAPGRRGVVGAGVRARSVEGVDPLASRGSPAPCAP